MAYIDVAKIENIRFMSHKILPLVYDESLSYYEDLCKFANKLNDVIDATNDLEGNVSTLNSNLNTLSSQVQAIADNINTFESEMTSRFNALEAEINANVDAKMAEVDAEMDAMNRRVDYAIASMEQTKQELAQYVDAKIAELTEQVNIAIQTALHELDQRFQDFEYEIKVYVKAQLQAYLDQIPEITSVTIIDPTTGELTDIQTVINNMYDCLNPNALDCFEIDHLGYTCEQLDNFMVHFIPRGLSVNEWMTKARQWVWTDPKLKMRNYYNGREVLTKKNVDINNALLKNSGSYSATEYDSVGITAKDYDDLEVKAIEFDWYGNTKVVAVTP